MVALRLICVVFFACWLQSVTPFCHMTPPSLHDTDLNHCVYKNRILALNSTFTDYETCIEMSCSADRFLFVCGCRILDPHLLSNQLVKDALGEHSPHIFGVRKVFKIGIKAGVMAPPPGCTVIKGDKCEMKLVDLNDNTLKCQPINIG